jgi:uncharacterized protein (TIGR00297 family)
LDSSCHRRCLSCLPRSQLEPQWGFCCAGCGTIIFGLGGLGWAVLLLTFFITSSGLSRAFKNRKREANEKYAKGGQRDAGQVFGNGGIATLFAALHFFFPDAAWPWLGFAASLAAVNADTWATELGVLNPTSPQVDHGLAQSCRKGDLRRSISGRDAGFFGRSRLDRVGARFVQPVWEVNWSFFVPVTIAGLLGALFDSLLGATVQAIYYCPACQKETERHPRIAAAPRRPKSAAGGGWITTGSILPAGRLGWGW